MKKTLILSISILILIGCGGGSSDVTTNPFNAPAISDSLKNEYLNAINNARGQNQTCGTTLMSAVPPLTWNDALYKAAYEHTNDMVEQNFVSHDGSGKETDYTGLDLNRASKFNERIQHNGYKYTNVAENITAGSSIDTAQQAVQAWLNSEGHCKNLMSPNFTEVGMAHIKKTGTTYTNYWTQNFGHP